MKIHVRICGNKNYANYYMEFILMCTSLATMYPYSDATKNFPRELGQVAVIEFVSLRRAIAELVQQSCLFNVQEAQCLHFQFSVSCLSVAGHENWKFFFYLFLLSLRLSPIIIFRGSWVFFVCISHYCSHLSYLKMKVLEYRPTESSRLRGLRAVRISTQL